MSMKKIFYFIAVISALVCASCTKLTEDVAMTSTNTNDIVSMTFNCGGEIDVTTSTLTKGGTNDLYLFNFWERNGSSSQVNEYAYFFTDNPSTKTMTFLRGKTYCCNVVYVPDGKTKILSQNGTYGFPFHNSCGGGVDPILNADPVYTTYYGFVYSYYYGATTPKGESGYGVPLDVKNKLNDIDVYYGYAEFDANDETELTINLYRMMFAVTLNVSNFTEGTIKVMDKYEVKPNENFSQVMEMPIMPFGLEYGEYVGVADYTNLTGEEIINNWRSLNKRITLTYVRAGGEEVTIYDGSNGSDISRLTNYTFTFDVNDLLNTIDKGFTANVETGAITKEENILINSCAQ